MIEDPLADHSAKFLGEKQIYKFFISGSKKFFSGVSHPQPEVNLVEMSGGICRAWGGVSDGEKILAKFPRVSEIFGVKEKPLAPPSGETWTIWVEMEGQGGRGFRGL